MAIAASSGSVSPKIPLEIRTKSIEDTIMNSALKEK